MSLAVIFLNEKPSIIVLLGKVILVLTTLIQEAEKIKRAHLGILEINLKIE